MSEKVYCKKCKYFAYSHFGNPVCTKYIPVEIKNDFNETGGRCIGIDIVNNSSGNCQYYEPNFFTFIKKYILEFFATETMDETL